MAEAQIYFREDTIAAVSTPPGRGAVAVIRISGPDAISLCKKIFRSRRSDALNRARCLSRGAIVDPETREAIDEALCVPFFAPRSYTGEDLAEIHCHGGVAVVKKILELVYRQGARPAEPGEFTFRAVRNGKLDLAQAEGIASLIESRSQLARALSLRTLEGAFSNDLKTIREEITSALIEIETQIEFPEDVAEESLGLNLSERMQAMVRRVIELQRRAVREQRFEQGIVVVLAGRPNVGKSSLFNRLLGRERAIVSPHPGTTRDSLEGTIELQGRPVTLIDTAGLRETQEEIEAIGVKRSRELLTTSHIILYVLDARALLSSEDERLLLELRRHSNDSRLVLVANKSDLVTNPMRSENLPKELSEYPLIPASAMEPTGLDSLLSMLENTVTDLVPADTESSYLINARQERVLDHIAEKVTQATQWVEQRAPLELIAEDLRFVLQDVAELDGTGVVPDLMNSIFSRFCIGK